VSLMAAEQAEALYERLERVHDMARSREVWDG
jgi:hypothetical protein